MPQIKMIIRIKSVKILQSVANEKKIIREFVAKKNQRTVFRNSVGDIPVCFLKKREKYE